jgi:hypothetical protein
MHRTGDWPATATKSPSSLPVWDERQFEGHRIMTSTDIDTTDRPARTARQPT